MSKLNFDMLVAAYMERDDRLAEIKAEYDARVEEIKQELEMLTAGMHKLLDETGLQNAATPHGTCYKQKWTAAKVVDWEETLGFIVQENAWDLLPRSVNKKPLMERAERGEIVPGVDITTGVRINVNRSR